MTSSVKPNRQFSNEYKLDAVRLGQSIGIPAASQRLGISDSALRKWDSIVRKRGESAFIQVQAEQDSATELRRLRARVSELEMEREILKKATAFFAKENG